MPLVERQRDSQRKKLYRAEDVAFYEPFIPGEARKSVFGRDGLSVAEAQSFIDGILDSAWFRDEFQVSDRRDPLVEVVAGRANSSARAGGGIYTGRISAPAWARREWVLLHELAHIVTRTAWGPYVAAHGWLFANVYLRLVGRFLGLDAEAALVAAFDAGRVKYGEYESPEPEAPVFDGRPVALTLF